VSRRRRLALVALGLALGLAGAEVVLRLWARTDTPLARRLLEWDPEASQVELLGPSCFRARPSSEIRYANGAVAHVNRLGFRGPEVAGDKPPGTFRVVLLGGSTSHGAFVDDDQTIDAHLRRALARAVPGRRIEVVNLGLDALDVLCDLERLRREGLPLAPDAVVLHSGVNDVFALRLPDPPAANAPERGIRAERRRAQEDRLRQSGPWRSVKHHVFLARVPGVAKQLLARSEPAPGPPEPTAAGLDAFEATIRVLADALPPGVTLLLSSPPSALPWKELDPPARGYLVVDEATTQRYRERLDERLRKVARDLATAGRPADYVPHALPHDAFLDDCHLTDEGNRAVAEDFGRVLAPLAGARDAGTAPPPAR